MKRVGSNVFIAYRIVVRKMPWKEPPTRAMQEVKHGPRAEQVENLCRTVAPALHEQRPAATTQFSAIRRMLTPWDGD